VELDLAADAGQRPKVCWQDNSDHDRVWTSTERTAGRSRTIAAQ
jgi:hypothetical protein